MHFRDRVVLVTGAASGMGRALCLRLGREGAVLGLLDRNSAGLEQLGAELTALGARVASAVADVRSREQVREAIGSLTARLGPTDVLVASAGLCGITRVDDLNIELMEEIVQVNLFGAAYAIDAVLPGMLERKQGQIVGIASLAALRAIPFEAAYCASKAALASYLEGLRPALRGRGIAVTTVFPGFVRTPLLDSLVNKMGTGIPDDTVDVETAAKRIAEAIRRRSRVCCFPRTTSWLASGARLLPPALYDWVMTRLAARVSLPY